jgi:UDP-N-acetylmuramate--alanine ligase
MSGCRGIAVGGTHGKSTTTAMTAYALVSAGRSPTYVVGAAVPQLGYGSAAGRSDLFVTEACEYRRSFLHLRPTVAVITCIEEDHLDYYRDIADIRAAFRSFAELPGPSGVVVAAGDDPQVAAVTAGLPVPVRTFGLSPSCWMRAAHVQPDDAGDYGFEVLVEDHPVARVQLAVPGLHNVRNALAAAAALSQVGLSPAEAAPHLGAFRGCGRRFEVLGDFGGVTLVDDYGHHPTAIAATLEAARERFPERPILCVFQPHQHNRTRTLFEAFARSLLAADKVLLPDIYMVRDTADDVAGVSSADLAERVNELGGQAEYFPGLEGVGEAVHRLASPGDVVVVVGAGSIWRALDEIKCGLGGGCVPFAGARSARA